MFWIILAFILLGVNIIAILDSRKTGIPVDWIALESVTIFIVIVIVTMYSFIK